MENPEIDPSTWRNVLYDKGNIFGATMTQINDCWPTVDYLEKIMFDKYHKWYTRINSK